jgi:hypothetical protein
MYAVHMEAEGLHLEAVAAQHARQPVKLVFADSVGDWARQSQIQNARGNPQGMACAPADGTSWIVALRRTIDAVDVETQICLMEGRGFASARQRLNCAKAYAEHLLLHELAHLTNNWDNNHERDCDTWAFDRLGHGAI